MKKLLLKVFAGGERGFTTLELMIVIIILAVIASIVTVTISSILTATRLSVANTEAANVRTAALLCLVNKETFPDSSDELYGSEVNYLSNRPDGIYFFLQNSGFVHTALACDDPDNPNDDGGITRGFIWDEDKQSWIR
jgi:prepilin-type N-terminal cleavage/methylation domain-containing protein